MKLFLKYILALVVIVISCTIFSANAQRMQNGSYSTVGYVKSDGTVQDGSYRTIGHIKSDGTVQDGSYRTIGHASGVSTEWAAVFFFFFFN